MTNEAKQLVCVRYADHVLYHRTSSLAMKPQIRRAIGWLKYECEQYIILAWDQDDEPPTLHGGDPKASGLVILRADILEIKKIAVNLELDLKAQQPKLESEYALQPSKRKTHSTTGEKTQ